MRKSIIELLKTARWQVSARTLYSSESGKCKAMYLE